MLFNLILEKPVSHNHIFADQLVEIPDSVAGEFPVVCDDFERKINGRITGLAVTVTVVVIRQQMPVELAERLLNLPVHLFQAWHLTESVKENGIAFDFGNLQPHLVGIDQDLQQFLNDKTALFDLRLADKSGEAAYVGNKKQSSILHRSLPRLPPKDTPIYLDSQK